MQFENFIVVLAVFSYGKILFGLKICITELHFENKYNGPINYQSLQLMLYRSCLSNDLEFLRTLLHFELESPLYLYFLLK